MILFCMHVCECDKLFQNSNEMERQKKYTYQMRHGAVNRSHNVRSNDAIFISFTITTHRVAANAIPFGAMINSNKPHRTPGRMPFIVVENQQNV